MTKRSASCDIRTEAGVVRGRWRDGIGSFRGVPYASPPVGPRRFLPPERPPAWDGVRPTEEPGPAPMQPPSRAEVVMGPMDVPGYSEDCLTLNVWTPAPASGAQLPVLVWLHGGGYMFGAGSASWYDGSVMARRGGMVVVTVNYRLGALGYLYLPTSTGAGGPAANLGLQDQCMALEWVCDNIAAFGGDPARVTVAGQSAGGLSVVALHAMPRASGLFQRAIVWSSGLQLPAHTLDEATAVTDVFLAAAGIPHDSVDALLDLPADRILEAQEKTLLQAAVAVGGDPRLQPSSMAPFRPVVDGDVLPEDPVAAARRGAMDAGDLLIGVNAEEMGFVFAFDETFFEQDQLTVLAQVEATWGDEGLRVFESYTAREAGRTAPEVLCTLLSEEGAVPSIELAERRAAAGRPAYLAWFTWRSPAFGGRLGAAHTVELPFVFNNPENWTRSPMLAGADDEEVHELGSALQDAWIAFAATGIPAEGWPPYVPPERAAMAFGRSVDVISNPAPTRSATGLTFGTSA
ncbi:MAG TPA: carboxylesterase family protein [Acidimicrobiales bacterium]|nr:carboxylesterase family protein [Acidimicrobiales bacterium]